MWDARKIGGSLGFLALAGCSSVSVPIGGDGLEGQGAEREYLIRGDLGDFVAGFEPVEVGVGWFPVNNGTYGDYGSHAVVSSARPLGPGQRTFVLDLAAPPPEVFTLYRYDDGVNPAYDYVSDVAQGTVVALGPRDTSTNEIFPDALLGVALETGVVYFKRDGDPSDPNDDVTGAAEWLGVEPTRGYHLYAIDAPAERRAATERCAWNGMCAASRGLGAFEQWHSDRQYARCVSEMPDAERCTFTFTETRTPDEAREHERCFALAMSRPAASCESPLEYPGNPLGFERRVTVRAGADVWQWYIGW